MSKKIQEKLLLWNDALARETDLKLAHLEKRLFNTYEPSQLPNPDFWQRLEKWIDNVSPEQSDEITLFNSIPELFYIGPDEFRELYRYTYNGPIARWLIEIETISLDDSNAQAKLKSAVDKTWFCPISDSMRINSFCHVNNIPSGLDFRPDWRSLAILGGEQKIRDYCSSNNIKNLVLLEDFVGGGSQLKEAINFADKFSDILSILIIPLVICPKGHQVLTDHEKISGFTYNPTLVVDKRSFINETTNKKQSYESLKNLAFNKYTTTSNGHNAWDIDASRKHIKPYHPLGWGETGGLIIMYTNAPDNTLPIFHCDSHTWSSLFPRHSRV